MKNLLLVIGLLAVAARAQDKVDLSIPSSLQFAVRNVATDSSSQPNPFLIRFSKARLGAGKVLRLSVRASAPVFRGPSGAPIPASQVAWQVLGAGSGNGFAGILSNAAWKVVYQSAGNSSSGSVDLRWILRSPLAAKLRAGAHDVSVEWKVESVLP